MWSAHDPHDALPQRVRIPEPEQRSGGEIRADLVVPVRGEAGLRVVVEAAVRAAPRDDRLAEVVEERGEPHRQRVARVGGCLHDRERVLVDREVVVAALLVEADRRAELRQELDENAGIARESQRAGGLGAEQELRELAHPVRREAAADALARDELHRRRLLPHLREQLLVGLEAELRDEAERADEPQRILAEALRRDRAQAARLEVGPAAERVDELARRRAGAPSR